MRIHFPSYFLGGISIPWFMKWPLSREEDLLNCFILDFSNFIFVPCARRTYCTHSNLSLVWVGLLMYRCWNWPLKYAWKMAPRSKILCCLVLWSFGLSVGGNPLFGIASLKYGAKENVKIHLTGAFNNAAQSFDDFYCGRHHDLGVGDRHYWCNEIGVDN